MIIRTGTLATSGIVRGNALIENRWFQLAFGITLSSLLPAFVIWMIWPDQIVATGTILHSAVGSFSAFAVGLLWYRRLAAHPGIQGIENVVMSFLFTFGVAISVLFILRFDYSRIYLLSAFTFTIVGFAWLASRLGQVEHPHFHVAPFGNINRLLALPKASWTIMSQPIVPTEHGAMLVTDLRADIPDDWESMLADSVLAGVPVFHIKQIEEGLSGRVDIEHLAENQFGSLLPRDGYRRVKIVFDWLVAALLLPFMIIPFVIVAILIKLDSPGPVFFRQLRIGSRGKPFKVIKFRSMVNRPVTPATEREAAMTQSDDARITRLGAVLRRYRIDELPQIINVLRGEMSWIGPRPEAHSLSLWYQKELPFYQYRHIVRPGLTGWAQVNQGHVVDLNDVHDKLRFDFYYIKYFSPWLDLLIAIRTARIIFGGFGAK